MLEMVDKEHIRKKYFVEGWSIRKISRNLNVARQTIRKALKDSNNQSHLNAYPKNQSLLSDSNNF